MRDPINMRPILKPSRVKAFVRALMVSAGVATAGLGTASVATAQNIGQDGDRRLDRQLRASGTTEDYRLKVDTSLSLSERTQIDYGGYVSFTGLFLNDSAENSVRLWQPEIVLYAKASIDGANEFFVRGRFSYRTFSNGDSFDGRGDRWLEPFPDRYWYEFDLRKALAAYQGESSDFNLNLRVGRQFIDWGSGIALSETLYAVKPTFEFGRQLKLETLAGITPDHTVDFDSSRWDFDERTRRGFYGAKLAYTLESGQEFYGFVLHMVDYTNDDRLRPPLNPIGRVQLKYDSNYYGLGSQGTIDNNWYYATEGIFQSGKGWSDPLRGPQTEEDITAGAGRALLGYIVRDESDTKWEVEGLFATGDEDRRTPSSTAGGNLRGTGDHQFNALGYANTGLAYAPALSNLLSLRLGVSSFPFRSTETFSDLQIGVDGYLFGKFTRKVPAQAETTDRRFLGGEVDVFANWRVTSDLSITARYGIFLPSAGVSGGKNARHFVLFGVNLGF